MQTTVTIERNKKSVPSYLYDDLFDPVQTAPGIYLSKCPSISHKRFIVLGTHKNDRTVLSTGIGVSVASLGGSAMDPDTRFVKAAPGNTVTLTFVAE